MYTSNLTGLWNFVQHQFFKKNVTVLQISFFASYLIITSPTTLTFRNRYVDLMVHSSRNHKIKLKKSSPCKWSRISFVIIFWPNKVLFYYRRSTYLRNLFTDCKIFFLYILRCFIVVGTINSNKETSRILPNKKKAWFVANFFLLTWIFFYYMKEHWEGVINTGF